MSIDKKLLKNTELAVQLGEAQAKSCWGLMQEMMPKANPHTYESKVIRLAKELDCSEKVAIEAFRETLQVLDARKNKIDFDLDSRASLYLGKEATDAVCKSLGLTEPPSLREVIEEMLSDTYQVTKVLDLQTLRKLEDYRRSYDAHRVRQLAVRQEFGSDAKAMRAFADSIRDGKSQQDTYRAYRGMDTIVRDRIPQDILEEYC